MKSIELNDAGAPLNAYVRELGAEPLLLTEGGRTIAALMPVENEDVDSLSLASNPKFVAILEKARAEARTGKVLTPDEVRRELGLTGA